MMGPIRDPFGFGERSAVLALIVAAVVSLNGCATNRFMASELPARYQARPTQNSQTLELAKIASPTIQNDLIGRGDVLEIIVSTGFNADDNATWVARVSERGEVVLPHIGPVQVEGLQLPTAEAQIASACVEKGLYRAPQVAVTMKQPMVNHITVVGAVKEPGTYELRTASSSLFDAITAAGSLAEDAGTQVEIRHPGYRDARGPARIAASESDGIIAAGFEARAQSSAPQTVQIDLISATKEGDGGYYLPDGAIVEVERRDPLPIHVSGLVNKAGAYPFPLGKELTLLDAISEAGGVSNPLANKIYIIRTKPGEKDPILIEANIRKAKHNRGLDNPLLAPGDYVSVEQTPASAIYEAARLIGFGISGRAF